MFVHLRCHSHYSFLRAVPRPEELIAAAKALGMPAVALTDTNGLYAAVPFYLAARDAGVKPIVGCTLDIDAQNENETRNSKLEIRTGTASRAPTSILLLAENLSGYSNLCALITQRQLDDRPITLEELNQHREGLVALYAVGENETRNSKFENRDSSITIHQSPFTNLKEIFLGALYLEVHRLSPADGRALREALRLSKELAVPIVATNNVHFLRSEEHLHHRVLNAIRTGSLLTTVAPPDITSAEAYFKSPAEMQRAFADYPEALTATLEIAERCNLELPLGKPIFPECTVPEGESPFSYLWKLCFEGARRRYQPLTPPVLARLTHELEVINQLHLAPYFLLVWEIVEEAKRRGIPAVARGSAASSIVTYCLGISRVCPLRWGLYFERFLNEQRGDVPDIDIDICGARRDELLEWVYQRWGAAHVAMISSFVTMHARLAVREVAKVFGLSTGEVNHFTRRLPHRPVREIQEALRTLPECRALPAKEEPWKTILAVAERLDDFPRHLGIHPCGTVISAQPLTRLVPLEVATKGIVVTQYDMNGIEALGLIKMDLLGQRGFTTMTLALDNIVRSSAGTLACASDFDAIPERDPATCAMLARGRTMGVFQIESPGLRGLLRALAATTLDHLCCAIAIIRPGAAEYGAKETFLKRLRQQEPVRYPHPSLEPILRDTLGVCVYQEQVMQIAQVAGGLSLAEADLVRRAKAKWKDSRERERLHGKFIKAAERMGIAPAAREETWQMVEKFIGFGFCKAHAATYADLAYRMAYLKAHYPAEFLAAMCSSGAGFYHVSAYVEEAKRWGIEVRLPSVNHSRLEYTTETVARVFRRGDSAGEANSPASEEAGYIPPVPRSIRIGLMQVKGLRLDTIEHILRSRDAHGPYRSLEDFLVRVPVERDEIESLIKCGAFDDVCAETRPSLLWRLNLLGGTAKFVATTPPGDLLFPSAAPLAHPGDAAPLLPDYTREQRLAYESAILEVCVSGHPLDLVARNGENWSTEIEHRVGQRVTLLGWLVTFRHVATKNCRNMMFATMEDQRGLFEVVLFPPAYERCGRWVFEARMLRVTGRVELDGHVNCEHMEPAKVL
jgi:DNA-directed DNA polymerase III PolC